MQIQFKNAGNSQASGDDASYNQVTITDGLCLTTTRHRALEHGAQGKCSGCGGGSEADSSQVRPWDS